MREEYDFSQARKNPYVKKLKKQITMKVRKAHSFRGGMDSTIYLE